MTEKIESIAHAMQVIQRLRAEVEALRKDAERYRWLRDGCNEKQSAASRIAANYYGMEWDAEIDAAMAASGGEEGV